MRHRRGERGAELVEFALVLPVLLLIVAGIFEFGLLFQRFQAVTNAAREGARVGVLPDYDAADVQARVAAYLTASGVTVPATVSVATIQVTAGTAPAFNAVQVTVASTYTFASLGPIAELAGGTFTSVPLRARTVMRLEGQ